MVGRADGGGGGDGNGCGSCPFPPRNPRPATAVTARAAVARGRDVERHWPKEEAEKAPSATLCGWRPTWQGGRRAHWPLRTDAYGAAGAQRRAAIPRRAVDSFGCRLERSSAGWIAVDAVAVARHHRGLPTMGGAAQHYFSFDDGGPQRPAAAVATGSGGAPLPPLWGIPAWRPPRRCPLFTGGRKERTRAVTDDSTAPRRLFPDTHAAAATLVVSSAAAPPPPWLVPAPHCHSWQVRGKRGCRGRSCRGRRVRWRPRDVRVGS